MLHLFSFLFPKSYIKINKKSKKNQFVRKIVYSSARRQSESFPGGFA